MFENTRFQNTMFASANQAEASSCCSAINLVLTMGTVLVSIIIAVLAVLVLVPVVVRLAVLVLVIRLIHLQRIPCKTLCSA